MWPVKVLYITLHRLWPTGNSVFNHIHWFYPETDSLQWILMLGVFTLSCNQSRMDAVWIHHSNEPMDKSDTLPDVWTNCERIQSFLLYFSHYYISLVKYSMLLRGMEISMAIYVRGTYRQTQLFYWLIIVRFTTTCFGHIPGPSSGCIKT